MLEFFNRYILLNTRDYGLELDLYINLIIICFTLALIISLVAVTVRDYFGKTILKRLLRLEAKDEQSARSISELGLSKSIIANGILKRGGKHTSSIDTVGLKAPTYDDYLKAKKEKQPFSFDADISQARFFIREENITLAKTVILKSASVVSSIVFSIIALVLCVASVILMPSILTLII